MANARSQSFSGSGSSVLIFADSKPKLARHSPPSVWLLPFRFYGSRRDAMEIDDTDLLGPPPQRPSSDKSICGRIMALFGFY